MRFSGQRRSSPVVPARAGSATGLPERKTAAGHSRRSVILGTAAAGAVLSVPAAGGAVEHEPGVSDNRSASYRETDHIREAYRRMRF